MGGRAARRRRLELRATSILRLPLDEASAKVRAGPPQDDEEDYGVAVWAGVIPLTLLAGEPQVDPRLSFDVPPPPTVSERYS